MENNNFYTRPNSGIGSLACYDQLEQVGEGTYGFVFKAKDKRNGEVVALKKLIIHKETYGFPLCAVREIKFLKSLQHKNIVKLKDIATSKGCSNDESSLIISNNNTNEINDDKEECKSSKDYTKEEREEMLSKVLRCCGHLYLVFEYMEHDLGGLVESKYKFNIREIKCIMKQIFEVLDYLSEKRIVHRDIKSSNILISNRHQIKLADFGLARSVVGPDGREGKMDLTNNVITMWYKPPELLLGTQRYSHPVDMWSAGCVFAELELGRPLFPGKTELEEIKLICDTIGTPDNDNWPDMTQLPLYDTNLKLLPRCTNTLRSKYYKIMSDPVLNILERILVADPTRRTTARIALSNSFFMTAPLPPIDPTDMEPLNLVAGASLHEYETKQRRRALAAAASLSSNETSENNICQPINNINNLNSNIVPSSNMNMISGGILPFNPPQPSIPRPFNPFTQAQAFPNKDHSNVNSYSNINNSSNNGYKLSQQSYSFNNKQSILPPPGIPPHFQQPHVQQNQYFYHQYNTNQPIINRPPLQYHNPQLNPHYTQQYQQNQQHQHNYQSNSSTNSNSNSYSSEKIYNIDDSRLTGNKRNHPP